MRVTTNMSYISYLRTLNETQDNYNKDQIRISSGERLSGLSDDPKALTISKNLTSAIDQKKNYISNIDNAVLELKAVSETVDSISENISSIREIAIESVGTGVNLQLPTLAKNVKDYLEDLVQKANSDYNGKLLFSGTLTTNSSIADTGLGIDDSPYELIQGEATADNPSGLSVVFKGNNESRSINKDENSTEVINFTSTDVFGENGTAVFDEIIGIYNTLAYQSDGTERTSTSPLTTEDLATIDGYQQKLAQHNETLTSAGAKIGAKIDRLEGISTIMTTAVTRLKEYRSAEADTDVTQTTIDLSKEETALSYTLKVGSMIGSYSLLDYLD